MRAIRSIMPANVLLVGDSWTHTTTGPQRGYKLLFEAALPGWTVVDEASSGGVFATVSGSGSVQANIDSWLSTNADTDIVICVTTGGNDVTGGATTAQLNAAFDAVLASCKSAGVVGVFAGIPTTSLWSAGQRTIAQEASDYRRDQCAAERIPFVPLIGELCDGSGIKTEYNGGDNVHLNDDGRQVLANYVCSAARTVRFRK